MKKDLDARLREQFLSTEQVFDGKIIKVQVDTVQLPDGKKAQREVVKHPGAVAIVPLTAQNEVVLVRQYRHATGEILQELPAGKIDDGESPLVCAKRELKEETGLTASCWRELFSFYTSPGFCNELLYMVLAQDLCQGEACLDEGEFLDVIKLPLDEVKQMILAGKIKDAKTITGIFALSALEEL